MSQELLMQHLKDEVLYHRLLAVCIENDTSTAEKLIQEGCPVNMKEIGGDTPLFNAVARYNTTLVQLLVSKGANRLPA